VAGEHRRAELAGGRAVDEPPGLTEVGGDLQAAVGVLAQIDDVGGVHADRGDRQTGRA
jgi:hypothetical protein